MEMPMESDWRKFRAIVPDLRERYVADRNARIRCLLDDPSKTETERFWDTFEEMRKEAKVLTSCLDGHSRSKMWFYMILMRNAGMLKQEDLASFSARSGSRCSTIRARAAAAGASGGNDVVEVGSPLSLSSIDLATEDWRTAFRVNCGPDT